MGWQPAFAAVKLHAKNSPSPTTVLHSYWKRDVPNKAKSLPGPRAEVEERLRTAMLFLEQLGRQQFPEFAQFPVNFDKEDIGSLERLLKRWTHFDPWRVCWSA